MKTCLRCSNVLLPGEIARNYCFGCRPPLEPAKDPPDFVRCRDCGLPLRKSASKGRPAAQRYRLALLASSLLERV